MRGHQHMCGDGCKGCPECWASDDSVASDAPQPFSGVSEAQQEVWDIRERLLRVFGETPAEDDPNQPTEVLLENTLAHLLQAQGARLSEAVRQLQELLDKWRKYSTPPVPEQAYSNGCFTAFGECADALSDVLTLLTDAAKERT